MCMRLTVVPQLWGTDVQDSSRWLWSYTSRAPLSASRVRVVTTTSHVPQREDRASPRKPKVARLPRSSKSRIFEVWCLSTSAS